MTQKRTQFRTDYALGKLMKGLLVLVLVCAVPSSVSAEERPDEPQTEVRETPSLTAPTGKPVGF